MAEKQDFERGSTSKLAGATPVDPKQNGRPTSAKQGSTEGGGVTSRWLAGESFLEGKDGALQVDREERLRMLKEKQNEERQRKLEELKQQALAAQKFREQKETERRRRLEELRLRDTDRRHQVEERKRQIWEAERDRREAILRKNQEREARIETRRKNERSQIVFAFGSSTPRMLDPGDAGSSYWASRRATSTTNVMTLSMSAAPPGPLTRRSSERELDGSKKRATSAGGIERKQHDPLRMACSSIYEVFEWGSTPSDTPRERFFSRYYDDENDSTSPNGFAWRRDAARRKTDLTPTLPSPRESFTPPGSGSRTPGGSGSSKKSTPGRAYSMSRLDLLAVPRRPRAPATVSQPTTATSSSSSSTLGKKVDVYRSMSVLPGSGGGGTTSKTAPNLIKGAKSMLHLGPVPPPRATRAERLRRKAREMAQAKSSEPPPSGMRSGELTPQRPQSSMSQSSVASNLSSASATLRARSATSQRRPRPFSIAVTGVSTALDSKSADRSSKSLGVTTAPEKPPIPKTQSKKTSPATSKIEAPPSAPPKKAAEKPKPQVKSSASTTPKASPLQSPNVETVQTNSKPQAIPNSSTAAVATTTTTTSIVESESPVEQNITNETTTNQLMTVPIEEVETTHSLVEITETVSTSSNLENIKEQQQISPPDLMKSDASDDVGPSSQRESLENITELGESDMTASMVAKIRITTEEEAKAALAERRRLAREQAEREAELERQRLEAERLAEEERQRKEEEEQRKMEEEQLRLLEEAKRAEEMRLQQAIEEAQKREEEEKKRKEEELKLKLEREEAERKAKEEAEKLRIEMELRLKQEEEDRQARRKRVEAIMSRTRGKGNNTSNTTPTKDGDDDSPPEDGKKASEELSVESNNFIKSERGHTNANAEENQLFNEEQKDENNRHNGHHHNGSLNSVAHNNVTNSLLVNLDDGQRIGEILETGDSNVAESKLSADAPAFIPQFQEKNEPHVMNDLLS